MANTNVLVAFPIFCSSPEAEIPIPQFITPKTKSSRGIPVLN